MKKLFSIICLSACTISHAAQLNLKSDKAVIRSIGLPVVETEKTPEETIYYFSSSVSSGLDIGLSPNTIHVEWLFSRSDKKVESFKQGEKATKALLGNKEGAAFFSKIINGATFNRLVLNNGIEVRNAQCVNNTCRYDVAR